MHKRYKLMFTTCLHTTSHIYELKRKTTYPKQIDNKFSYFVVVSQKLSHTYTNTGIFIFFVYILIYSKIFLSSISYNICIHASLNYCLSYILFLFLYMYIISIFSYSKITILAKYRRCWSVKEFFICISEANFKHSIHEMCIPLMEIKSVVTLS